MTTHEEPTLSVKERIAALRIQEQQQQQQQQQQQPVAPAGQPRLARTSTAVQYSQQIPAVPATATVATFSSAAASRRSSVQITNTATSPVVPSRPAGLVSAIAQASTASALNAASSSGGTWPSGSPAVAAAVARLAAASNSNESQSSPSIPPYRRPSVPIQALIGGGGSTATQARSPPSLATSPVLLPPPPPVPPLIAPPRPAGLTIASVTSTSNSDIDTASEVQNRQVNRTDSHGSALLPTSASTSSTGSGWSSSSDGHWDSPGTDQSPYFTRRPSASTTPPPIPPLARPPQLRKQHTWAPDSMTSSDAPLPPPPLPPPPPPPLQTPLSTFTYNTLPPVPPLPSSSQTVPIMNSNSNQGSTPLPPPPLPPPLPRPLSRAATTVRSTTPTGISSTTLQLPMPLPPPPPPPVLPDSPEDAIQRPRNIPDNLNAVRNPPYLVQRPIQHRGGATGQSGSGVKCFAICGRFICVSASNEVRVYMIGSGECVGSLYCGEERVTAMMFQPSTNPEEHDHYLLCGTKSGNFWLVDVGRCISEHSTSAVNPSIAARGTYSHSAAITRILRHGLDVITLCDAGSLAVWHYPDSALEHTLMANPVTRFRMSIPMPSPIAPNVTAAAVVGGDLWITCAYNIYIYTLRVDSSSNTAIESRLSVELNPPDGRIVALASDAEYESHMHFTEYTTHHRSTIQSPGITASFSPLLGVVTIPRKWAITAHDDGTYMVWDRHTAARLGTVRASTYQPTTLAVLPDGRVWAGRRTGRISVYEIDSNDASHWTVVAEWFPYIDTPVERIAVDWRTAIVAAADGKWRVAVATLSALGQIDIWDGSVVDSWRERRMQQRRNDYTDRRTLKVLVCSWNIDACKPSAIDKSAHPDDQQFLANWLGAMKPDEPSIIVVGLQEVVDLESKKVTAKTLFRSGMPSRKNQPGDAADAVAAEDTSELHREATRRHTMWRDRIAKMVSISAGDNHRYRLVASHGMVGLFSLVFVRETEMPFIRDVYITQVKTGFKGLHGNKGAIICRVIHGASSLCFVNCHLAAGESKQSISSRNKDCYSVLNSTCLPPIRHDLLTAQQSQPTPQNQQQQQLQQQQQQHQQQHQYSDAMSGSASSSTVTVNSSGPVRDVLWANGGDGSRVMDHSIVFFSGDLNYRISRPRDEVEKLIVAKDWDALLRHDQLNDQFINYPTFALRNLIESPPPRFAPTYKYNVGTTKYDTSLKKRTPAWCDRILFRRGSGIRPLQYQRHENLLSDHRPISGAYEVPVYRFRGDNTDLVVLEDVKTEWKGIVSSTNVRARLAWLVDIGVPSEVATAVIARNPSNLAEALADAKLTMGIKPATPDAPVAVAGQRTGSRPPPPTRPPPPIPPAVTVTQSASDSSETTSSNGPPPLAPRPKRQSAILNPLQFPPPTPPRRL